jgi:hypothetical protein
LILLALSAASVPTVSASSHFLPDPQAGLTVPVGVVLVGLAVLSIARKLVKLALVAVVVAALIFAYQGGAFDHFVDKGKHLIDEHDNGAQ